VELNLHSPQSFIERIFVDYIRHAIKTTREKRQKGVDSTVVWTNIEITITIRVLKQPAYFNTVSNSQIEILLNINASTLFSV
jgi:hypothetical protein